MEMDGTWGAVGHRPSSEEHGGEWRPGGSDGFSFWLSVREGPW